jgi:hypothetical protein
MYIPSIRLDALRKVMKILPGLLASGLRLKWGCTKYEKQNVNHSTRTLGIKATNTLYWGIIPKCKGLFQNKVYLLA